MKIPLSIVCLLGVQLGFGQIATTRSLGTFLKFETTSLLPIYTGTSFRFGVEIKGDKKFGNYFELGYYPNFYGAYHVRGGIARWEVKRYDRRGQYQESKHHWNLTYTSLEVFVKSESYNTYDSIRPYPMIEKFYSVSTNLACLNLQFGTVDVYTSGIILDTHVGIGLRVKHTTNSLSREENENIESSSDYGPNVFTHTAGNFIYPNLNFGIKIGYWIKKK